MCAQRIRRGLELAPKCVVPTINLCLNQFVHNFCVNWIAKSYYVIWKTNKEEKSRQRIGLRIDCTRKNMHNVQQAETQHCNTFVIKMSLLDCAYCWCCRPPFTNHGRAFHLLPSISSYSCMVAPSRIIGSSFLLACSILVGVIIVFSVDWLVVVIFSLLLAVAAASSCNFYFLRDCNCGCRLAGFEIPLCMNGIGIQGKKAGGEVREEDVQADWTMMISWRRKGSMKEGKEEEWLVGWLIY